MAKAKTPCPNCNQQPDVVWRSGGRFHQRTECQCGRKTRWANCGHGAVADSTDEEIQPIR